uniref:VWFA domain-containing protein n=1 Tax=Guillardia theta TaxID=55529 RepID=A0A7S4K5T4_GUITH|mmetsp:Transcript_21314/g.70656  ORF Transcript_21314/g.70656 Transcript_21314/m.70656 type:complete len:363 (+) Transcript_21314:67-1155(+)
MEEPEELKEDETTGALKIVRRKVQKTDASATEARAIRKGVIRFVVLIVDCSESMNQRDMRPTRLGVVQQVVGSFLDNFFDQNPISQVSLVELRGGKAEKLTELSGNSRHHKNKLEERLAAHRSAGAGMPSMRAGLEVALQLLEMQASYGTREVLMMYGSLSSCDRGDIFQTADRLKSAGVKVNIVGMAAELYVARAVSKRTGGSYSVATHAVQVRDMVLKHTSPSPVEEGEGGKEKPAAGMWVGFPRKSYGALGGWQCPRCMDVVKEIPADCGLCGLKLLSSSHLARSYHHLFPVQSFHELEDEEGPATSTSTCGGCGVLLGKESKHVCPACKQVFCGLCDGFIHEMLHVCPGCEGREAEAS